MGQGTESSEPTCAADRPTEVSVIRFVSRNRTIEEIAPKKEVYMCKQRGCNKIFNNLEEYKSHEVSEILKIRFICREPGCGEELSDPGSMWRHYQEWHNNETNVFVCPYTSCSSVHATSESLEEHIESSHRQLPTIPTEPEIICFEGADNVMEDNVGRVSESENSFESERSVITDIVDNGVVRQTEYSMRSDSLATKQVDYSVKEENVIMSSQSHQSEDYSRDQSKLRAALIQEDYSKNSETTATKIPKNKDLLITNENFLVKYESKPLVCSSDNVLMDSSVDGNNIVYINNDVSLTRTSANQEHKIELGNLEKVFRSGFEENSTKLENTSNGLKNTCSSNDEEYTPKKQRMSRSKQEPYKCEINGCGKTYKYISHYRHHQDSHKLIANAMNANSSKSAKPKLGKATAISFFICKMPGCGVQLSNVTALWKHYQETHANAKPPASLTKSTEMYRCKFAGCEMEFCSSLMLHKHFNEVHSKNSINNTSPNLKTANGSGVLVKQTYHDVPTTQRVNFKTDLKAKHSLDEYTESNNKNSQSSIVKKETGD
ncbi:transcriptional activator cubitus interruptus-like [Phymastichus coffea]|uniref:transcriptional activator cubitus interruptus-like n=1 Tax=Phymastichus coffea TaxID=108790 RepID=UPI00273C522E|nr:transcriptional activator cubitus interruptus-like [Phymastichus coffea]